MRKGGEWLVGAPLALAGVAAGHALANVVFGSPEGRSELFASAGSGVHLLPMLAAVAAAVVVLGVTCRALGRGSLRSARAFAAPFALLPPIAFVLLELFEALFHRGTLPIGEVVEPRFLAALAFQLPFAATAYLLARLLIRAGDGLRTLLAREPATAPLRVPLALDPREEEQPRSFACWTRGPSRAPPVGLGVFA